MSPFGVANLFPVAAAGLACVGFVLFAILYIRAAGALRVYLMDKHPAVFPGAPPSNAVWPGRVPAQRLSLLVMDMNPRTVDDPVCRQLTNRARLWMALWFLAAVALMVALGFAFQGTAQV